MTRAGVVSRPRVTGVDAARAVALAGMFATHTLPLRDGGASTGTALLAEGRASALFAVLAGAAVSLSTGGPVRPRSGRDRLAAGAGLTVRGLLVGLIGLVLVSLGPPVLVVLAFYGLLLMVAVPFVGAGPRMLATSALLACALTPVISHVLRPGPEVIPTQAGLGALADPAGLLTHLAVVGFYPVLTWTTYLLTGMAVGRLDLRRPRVATGLLIGGTVLAVTSASLADLLVDASGAALDPQRRADRFYGTAPTDTWWWLAVDAPHSGAPLDLAATTGSALAVLGAMLLIAGWVPGVGWVPAAVGAAPLTLYVLHCVALAVCPATPRTDGAVLLAHLLGALAIGVGLRVSGLRGPLESAVSAAARASRAAVRGAVAVDRPPGQ